MGRTLLKALEQRRYRIASNDTAEKE